MTLSILKVVRLKLQVADNANTKNDVTNRALKWTRCGRCVLIDCFRAGKGPSIWDTYAHEGSFIVDGATGDVAADSYHQYEQDVSALTELGVRTVS